jgi:hypothetical protein
MIASTNDEDIGGSSADVDLAILRTGICFTPSRAAQLRSVAPKSAQSRRMDQEAVEDLLDSDEIDLAASTFEESFAAYEHHSLVSTVALAVLALTKYPSAA